MRIDSAALPFVLIALLPSAILWWLGWLTLAVVVLLIPMAIALFFRDPARIASQDPALVLAPADGRVMYAGPVRPGDEPLAASGGAAEVADPCIEWQQITIFLSVLDVHINRTPVSGRVTRVEYHPGTFLPAFKPESSKNERSEIWFDHQGVPIVARQVVGMLARRVVCRLTVGQQVEAGAHLGLMKFGSRMDVFVPPTATIRVVVGDKVRAAETVLAQLA